MSAVPKAGQASNSKSTAPAQFGGSEKTKDYLKALWKALCNQQEYQGTQLKFLQEKYDHVRGHVSPDSQKQLEEATNKYGPVWNKDMTITTDGGKIWAELLVRCAFDIYVTTKDGIRTWQTDVAKVHEVLKDARGDAQWTNEHEEAIMAVLLDLQSKIQPED
jgi:hypothetical protein